MTRTLPPTYGAGLALTLVMCLTACSGDDAGARQDPFGRARSDNLLTEGLRTETADLDRDGQADQWTYVNVENDRAVRAERDIDFNGSVDLYEYYDSTGHVIEEELHLDYDRSIDVVRYYRDDTLLRRELVVGFGGDFSYIKYYNAEGEVLRVERDSDGDGSIDTAEYFEDSRLIRVGRDEDGDGSFEVLEAAP